MQNVFVKINTCQAQQLQSACCLAGLKFLSPPQHNLMIIIRFLDNLSGLTPNTKCSFNKRLDHSFAIVSNKTTSIFPHKTLVALTRPPVPQTQLSLQVRVEHNVITFKIWHKIIIQVDSTHPACANNDLLIPKCCYGSVCNPSFTLRDKSQINQFLLQLGNLRFLGSKYYSLIGSP